MTKIESDLSLPIEFIYIAESSTNPFDMLMKLKYEYTYEDVYDLLEYMEVQKFYRIERERINKDANR